VTGGEGRLAGQYRAAAVARNRRKFPHKMRNRVDIRLHATRAIGNLPEETPLHENRRAGVRGSLSESEFRCHLGWGRYEGQRRRGNRELDPEQGRG